VHHPKARLRDHPLRLQDPAPLCIHESGAKNVRSDAFYGVGSVPGDGFGNVGQDALRLSFSCSTDMVREGGRLIREILTAR